MFQSRPYYVQSTPHYNPGGNQETRGYLFYETFTNRWNIGSELGSMINMKFRTEDFRLGKCPGDNGNLKKWKYSGQNAWKNDPNLKIKCLNL